jgi:hypothetical protein
MQGSTNTVTNYSNSFVSAANQIVEDYFVSQWLTKNTTSSHCAQQPITWAVASEVPFDAMICIFIMDILSMKQLNESSRRWSKPANMHTTRSLLTQQLKVGYSSRVCLVIVFRWRLDRRKDSPWELRTQTRDISRGKAGSRLFSFGFFSPGHSYIENKPPKFMIIGRWNY